MFCRSWIFERRWIRSSPVNSVPRTVRFLSISLVLSSGSFPILSLLLLLLLFYLFILFCVHYTLARPLVMREHSSSMAVPRWMLLLELWRIAVGRGTLLISATDCFRRLYLCLSLRFCLRYRRLRRCVQMQEKEVEENDEDSWQHGGLQEPRHTWRGTKDTHVAMLGEGLAGELRDGARCCTRGQCQGSGRGLKKCNIDCVRSTDIFCTKYHEGRKLHGEQVVGYVVSGPLTTAVWKGSIYQRTSSTSGLVFVLKQLSLHPLGV